MFKKIVSTILATICAVSMITGSAAAMETGSMYNGDTNTPPLSGLDLYNYYMEVGEVPPIFDETDDGGIDPNGIIGGVDDRKPVADTTIAPYKAIGRLYVTGINHCTCSAFAKNAVLTAAHAVYKNNSIAEFEKIELGLNGSNTYKTITTKPKEIIVCPEYMNGDTSTICDWAIILFDTDISKWAFGYSTGLKTDTALTTTGYPKTKADPSDTYTGKEQYTCSGNATKVADSYFECNMDATGGQSGSPIYDSANHIVGVACKSGSTKTTARRVKGELYEIMAAIRAGTYVS